MTEMIQAAEGVLKTDGLGRIKTPPERREQLLDEFERSGLTGMKFAALTGIKYPTFASWLAKRRRDHDPAAKATKAQESLRWLEAVVEEAQAPGVPGGPGLVLELPGGVRARIADARQAVLAADLLRALARSC
jgi:hypothetical protein